MEKVFFEEINGKKVFCYLAEGTNKKIVIMSHGFRGTTEGPARQFVDFQRALTPKGYSVLRFDQPNSGNSDGDYIDTSFTEWVKTIVYFAKKYLDQGYEVALLGQSMGATASTIASHDQEIRDKISTLLLWVPDPETDFNEDPQIVMEEGGQKYRNTFWQEAKDGDFFNCLGEFNGKIHLVYGEVDRYVSEDLMEKTKGMVTDKQGEVMVLKGQDHSPWEFSLVHEVYDKEIAILER